jgi:transcriptional regulator with XRE-family HTH domain
MLKNSPNANATVKSVAADVDPTSLGAEVRKLRKARGKSLADVSSAIGRSVSYVSQLERGQTEPSISDLKGIAQILGVPLGWFFMLESVPPAERSHVVRVGARRRLGTGSDGLLEELLSPDIGGIFETFLSTFEPGAKLLKPTLRDTEEEGYVIKGSLDLWIGKKRFLLHAGDSFRIVREPFRWANPGDVETVVVWVISPPTY